MSRIRHITVIAVGALALSAQTAVASNYHDAIRDCNDDGVLQGHYSQHTLDQARHHVPASLREYSDCEDVLARALAAARKKGPNATGGGDAPAASGDPKLTTESGAVAPNYGAVLGLHDSAKRATKDNAAPKVAVGGEEVSPGTAGLAGAAARKTANDLPESLLVALMALAAMGVLAGILLLRQGWPETRRVALRIFRR